MATASVEGDVGVNASTDRRLLSLVSHNGSMLKAGAAITPQASGREQDDQWHRQTVINSILGWLGACIPLFSTRFLWSRLYRQTGRQTDGQTHGRTDSRTHGRTGRTCVEEEVPQALRQKTPRTPRVKRKEKAAVTCWTVGSWRLLMDGACSLWHKSRDSKLVGGKHGGTCLLQHSCTPALNRVLEDGLDLYKTDVRSEEGVRRRSSLIGCLAARTMFADDLLCWRARVHLSTG